MRRIHTCDFVGCVEDAVLHCAWPNRMLSRRCLRHAKKDWHEARMMGLDLPLHPVDDSSRQMILEELAAMRAEARLRGGSTAQVYVDPNARPGGDGSQARPFVTLAEAQRAASGWTKSVEVRLGPGTIKLP